MIGRIEVKNIVEDINTTIQGEDGYREKIFKDNPHYNFDNYFSGGKVTYTGLDRKYLVLP